LEKKFFTLNVLNENLKNFSFVGSQARNKPGPVIRLTSPKNALKLTAAARMP